MSRSPFQIGNVRADPARNILRGEGGEIAIEPKIMETLVYLTSRPGDVVLREDITYAVWPNSYSGDESLTRAVSRLRRAFQSIAGAANYIETIPKRGYRVVATVHSVDENAPESEAPPHQPPIANFSANSGFLKPVFTAATGLMVFGFAVFSIFKPETTDVVSTGVRSIERQWTNTTIELSEISAPQENAELEKVSSELLNQIKHSFASAGIPTLDRSTADDTGSNDAVTEILPVYKLRGAVQGAYEKPSVTLFLEDNRTQETFWSRQFVSPSNGTQQLLLEIPGRVATIIECANKNLATIDDANFIKLASLTFSWCEFAGSGEETLRAIELAREIRDIQPARAAPHAMYAISNLIHLGTVRADTPGNQRYFDAGKSAAEMALELDPENELASLALAMTLPSDKNLAEKEKLLIASGLEQSEHGYSLSHYIDFLRFTGRIREALQYSEIATAKAPHSPFYKAMNAFLLAVNDDTSQSVMMFQELQRMWPDYVVSAGYLRMLSLFVDEYDFSTLLSHELEFSICEKTFLNSKDVAIENQIEVLDVACLKSANPISMDYYIRMLATLGAVDVAYEHTIGRRFNWHGASHFLFYPEMKEFRRDPRFFSSLQATGLIEYWLESEKWPDFCAEPSFPYDCRTAALNAMVANAPT